MARLFDGTEHFTTGLEHIPVQLATICVPDYRIYAGNSENFAFQRLQEKTMSREAVFS